MRWDGINKEGEISLILFLFVFFRQNERSGFVGFVWAIEANDTKSQNHAVYLPSLSDKLPWQNQYSFVNIETMLNIYIYILLNLNR
jgi:hypothetical protein